MSAYFTYTALTKFSLARAEQVNAKFQSVSVGFDLLPDPDQLNQGRHIYCVAGGSANVITVSLPKAPLSYVAGLHVRVKIVSTTTTDATLNVNGLGAKAVVRADGSATAANDLVAGQIVDMVYDGTAFRLIAASEVLAAASAASAAASASAANTSATNAATSATNAATSETNAAASAAAAAAANKVAKAGDTMTGALTMSTGADESIKLRASDPYLSGYNALGTVRQGALQFGSVEAVLTSDVGAIRLVTGASTRFTISAAGAATFTGSISAAGLAVSSGTGQISITSTTNFGGQAAFVNTLRSWTAGMLGSVGSESFVIRDNTAGASRLTIDNAGAVSISGTLAVTGVLTAPTAVAGTNTTQVATTAFVAASFAPLSSPGLTGTPTAPTAVDATNTTQIATTAFVQTRVSTALSGVYAPLASPALTGTPTAPTAGGGTNTTQIATTAFVQSAFSASPALGGTPTAPTAASGTATTQIATTAFVDALRDLPQRAVTGSDTLVLTDRAKHICYTGAGGHTETIPPNSSVAFPVGTTIVLVNDSSSTWAIARGVGVTARWAQTGADANRTLAAGGMATLLKVGTDRWIITGAGLS